ncbi:ciliary microtubule inner protein 5-like isoform X4 [Crassostrea virginica]
MLWKSASKKYKPTFVCFFPKYVTSQYHDNCIPPERRQITTQTTEKAHKEGDYSQCDAVTQDRIWKQSVGKEGMCLKNWEENWGFLTEFDSKGNQKPKEELPEGVNMYSNAVPNTNSGNYGNKVKSELGVKMQKLEHQFFGGQRKRKLGSEMVCY